jgi:hypothetical protein
VKKIIAILLFAFSFPAYSATVYLACTVTSADEDSKPYLARTQYNFNIVVDTEAKYLYTGPSFITKPEYIKNLDISEAYYFGSTNGYNKTHNVTTYSSVYIDRYSGSIKFTYYNGSQKKFHDHKGICELNKQWQPKL